MTASSIVQGARALPMLLSAEQRYPLSTAFSGQPSARGQRINQWSCYRRTGTKGRSCEIARLVGMSLRQVILAFIVGLVVAVLVLWLAPELVR